MSTETAAAAVKYLSPYTTCELSDALLKIQRRDTTGKALTGGHIPDIHMYSGGRKICGIAYTVQMVHGNDTTSPKPSKHFVDAAPKDCVIMISAPKEVKNAVWGGLMTSGAIARGVMGVIISGRCRDISEHLSESFPVFARGKSTLGQSPFTRPAILNDVVTIDGGNGWEVEVRSGKDVLVADEDGVVCIPVNDAEEVASLAQKGRESDANCLPHIQAGEGVAFSFKEYRKPNADTKVP